MLLPLFLAPYQHFIDNLTTEKRCIKMCDMCKVKKQIERRKDKALKRGGFYAKYKLK